MKKTILLALFIWMVLLPSKTFCQTDEKRKRLIELNTAIQTLDEKAQEISDQKKKLEADRQQLLDSFAGEQFREQYESPNGYLVISMAELPNLTLLVNGKQKTVHLQGLFVSHQSEAQNFLRKKLISGTALVRCKDEYCAWVFLYAKVDEPSLNGQLVDAGFATMLNSTTLGESRKTYKEAGDLSAVQPTPSLPANTAPIPQVDSGSSSSNQPGTEVQVKGYYRKDGTYVQPHTRSAPRRKP